MDIKILDCTLRDGGYTNNWEFGADNIGEIYSSLAKAGIEFIECGFLSSKVNYYKDKTLYNNLQDIPKIAGITGTIMANFGEYNFSELKNTTTDFEIRIAFKINELPNIKQYAHNLKKNNISFSLNPMHIGLYSKNNLNNLIEIVNDLSPKTITVVDTMGIMTEQQTQTLFLTLHNNINNTINFGLHAHDNLNYSFSNTKTLLDMDLNRTIIIDTSLGGLARGAGILATEVFAKYLNSNYYKNYNLDLINIVSNKIISPIKKTCNFNDNYHYYLASKYKCHPNYATYLKSQGLSSEKMEEIFKLIPSENKINFSENFINQFINKESGL